MNGVGGGRWGGGGGGDVCLSYGGQDSQNAKSLEPDLTRKTFTFWSECVRL